MLYWPIMAHQVLKLLQQKPQQCGAIKTVGIYLTNRPTITIRFDSIQNEKTLFAHH